LYRFEKPKGAACQLVENNETENEPFVLGILGQGILGMEFEEFHFFNRDPRGFLKINVSILKLMRNCLF
jgi:hypothetical protein